MNIITAKDYRELSSLATQKTADFINANPNSMICFAAGDTPLGMLTELVTLQNRGKVDLSSVWYAQLDEWVGLGPEEKGSCIKVMTDAFFAPAGIPDERVQFFDGLDPNLERQCREMENWLASHDGIGYAVLGVGMNGHIGFNEPGAPDAEGCIIVELDDTTKTVSKKYFGKELPVTKGLTIGWRTLYDARTVVLIASGAKKAPIIKDALEGPITAGLPASLFQDHRNITVMLDDDAASLLKK